MNLKDVNISEVVEQVRAQLKEDHHVTPALRASIELILMVVVMLAERFGLNSQNSSIPPSKDPNRPKTSKASSKRPPGGQKGHQGSTLEQTDFPDEVKMLKVDRSKLPSGRYKEVGYQKRQVFDIDIVRTVVEYQAQILEDEQGQHFIADFPEGVTSSTQYGSGVKAHAVYLSQYQLLPYQRIEEYFSQQLGLPISAGSIFNFNKEAAQQIQFSGAETVIKNVLRSGPVLHVDETGININGKLHWLHSASTEQWTYFSSHQKRGQEAMDAADILPHFSGVLCHDHWKPYYQYTTCDHALCNAHHLRELERAWEKDNQAWARSLQELLKTMNGSVLEQNGTLSLKARKKYIDQYRKILEAGEQESPPPDESLRKKGQRGRLKRSKSRALLERLRKYEDDVLRFLKAPEIPFTNNQGENDIRMTKVHQKISGCFRSHQGAEQFCLIRSYLSSCRKQSVSASEALTMLFRGQLPGIFNQAPE